MSTKLTHAILDQKEKCRPGERTGWNVIAYYTPIRHCELSTLPDALKHELPTAGARGGGGGGWGWWKPIILQTDKYTYRHWCSIGWKRRPYLCLDKDKLAPLSLWAGQKTFAFANERLSKARHQTPHTDLENRRAS